MAKIVPINIIPPIMNNLFIGKPAENAIIPIIAIITPAEPRSLSINATTTPITAIRINRGFSVLLVEAISSFAILDIKNDASQTISVNLINSAT